jgi:hypothetical protein
VSESLARSRDFYLTTRNSHNKQTSMPSVGFEPTISTGERPQTYALDRAAIETGTMKLRDGIKGSDTSGRVRSVG